MKGWNATPVEGTDCPYCDDGAEPTAILGPATGARCVNDDCPIRDFWTTATREDFGLKGPVGDIEFNA